MRKLLVFILVLSGCTLNVTDKRLPPETIAQAFQQRDQVLIAQSKRLDACEAAVKELSKEKKHELVK